MMITLNDTEWMIESFNLGFRTNVPIDWEKDHVSRG